MSYQEKTLADFDTDGEEYSTRKVVNAFIRKEFIAAPNWCWWYYDWLKEYGFQMEEWIRQIDCVRGDHELGVYLHHVLYCTFRRAHRDGTPYPAFMPEPTEPFIDPGEIHNFQWPKRL